MKIAAFYENIAEGAKYAGISTVEAVNRLMKEGMELLYIGGFTLRESWSEVENVLNETKILVEGIHDWIDLAHNPENPLLEQTIQNAAKLHSNNVLIVPGLLQQGDNPEIITDNIKIGMKRAVNIGLQLGIPVSMENLDNVHSVFNSINGLKQFMDAIPELKCSFDTGNFVIHHEDELAGFELFRDRLCTIHVKDRTLSPKYDDVPPKICADGSNTYVASIGTGYIKIREILSELIAQEYAGNLIVEAYEYSPSHTLEGIVESIRWLQKELTVLKNR